MKRCGLLLAALLVSACGSDAPELAEPPAEAAVPQISGTVTYRERMSIPHRSVVRVELQDVSLADAPATVLASVELKPGSKEPPYPFTLDYDPSDIIERNSYVLRATIMVGERLLFSSTGTIEAFGQSPAEIVVKRVPSTPASALAIDRGQWTLRDLPGSDALEQYKGYPITIAFDSSSGRVSGFSGCNSFGAGYTREGANMPGAALQIEPVATTRRACPNGLALESEYTRRLSQVKFFRFVERRLELTDGNETLLVFGE